MKLTNTQLALLYAAAQRADRAIEIPSHIKGGGAKNLVARLLSERLVEDIRTQGAAPVWRRDDRGRARSLRITQRGLALVAAGSSAKSRGSSPSRRARTRRARPAPDRTGSSKQARLLDLLARPTGATIADLVQASGWQQHSVRGFLAGVVRKKLGLALVSDKAERGRRYRIVRSK